MALSYDHAQLIWKAANACQLLWIFLLYSCVTFMNCSHACLTTRPRPNYSTLTNNFTCDTSAMMLWNGLLMVVDLARNLVLRAVL